MRTHKGTTILTSLAAAATVLVSQTGCTDTLVEPKSTVTETNVFNDPASYFGFLAKLYAGLAVSGQQGPAGQPDIQGIDEGFSQYIRLLWQMQELPTDEAVIAWQDVGLPELNSQMWASSNVFLGAMYGRIFFQVSLANEFLRQTDDEVLDARGVTPSLRAEIQGFRAEARFLRALSYWHGIDLFGDIPLVREDFGIGATPPPQGARAEIFSFLVSELTEIRDELPAPGRSSYGRATGAAADMLLAKLYLNASVYTGSDQSSNALPALERVIGSGGFSLDDDYRSVFLADNHDSPEIIFAVPFDGRSTQTWGGMTFLVHAAIGGNMNAGDFGVDFGWWGLRVRPDFVALFPGGADSDDGRAGVFFTDGQSVQIASVSDFFSGLAAPKYSNVTSKGQPGSHPSFPDTDYPMFRLADAYLMFAEAALRGGGNRSRALAFVNALRARAYGADLGAITDAELTLALILDERARELYWEGHRRTDLVRFGRFTTGAVWAWKGGVPQGRETEAFRNLYPLPADELLANPNLKQNPGY